MRSLACLVGWLVALSLPTFAWGAEPGVTTRTHKTMGTQVQITVYTKGDERSVARADAAITRAFAEFDRVNVMMSTWLLDSPVSQLNAKAGTGEKLLMPQDVLIVLRAAAKFSKLSGGAFDVTVGAFAGVWKFDEDKDGTLPDPALVEERKALVNWQDLHVKGKHAWLARAGQKITLGGIAKGYATDLAVKALRRSGARNFIVQAGGDMYVSGKRGGRKWRVGIRDPRGTADAYFAFLELANETFSTSGDYERYIIKDGVRYHHILDPKTGRPATACRSVTVIAKNALTADGLSKGLFILGPELGLKLLQKVPGAHAVWVTKDNRVVVSPGLKKRLNQVKPPTDGV